MAGNQNSQDHKPAWTPPDNPNTNTEPQFIPNPRYVDPAGIVNYGQHWNTGTNSLNPNYTPVATQKGTQGYDNSSHLASQSSAYVFPEHILSTNTQQQASQDQEWYKGGAGDYNQYPAQYNSDDQYRENNYRKDYDHRGNSKSVVLKPRYSPNRGDRYNQNYPSSRGGDRYRQNNSPTGLRKVEEIAVDRSSTALVPVRPKYGQANLSQLVVAPKPSSKATVTDLSLSSQQGQIQAVGSLLESLGQGGSGANVSFAFHTHNYQPGSIIHHPERAVSSPALSYVNPSEGKGRRARQRRARERKAAEKAASSGRRHPKSVAKDEDSISHSVSELSANSKSERRSRSRSRSRSKDSRRKSPNKSTGKTEKKNK
jgi:hypothetical protein